MTSGAKAQTGVVKTSVVTLAGDATGPSNANTVAKINGSPLGTTTGATTGYVLTWNGSAWAPAAVAASSVTMGGDVTGNSATSTVAKIQGSAVAATAPTSNQVLQWNGTAWTPTTLSSAGVTSFNTRTGAVVPANADYLAVASGGLTGAVAATRFVGGTTNGAPTAGTFAVGDFIVDQTASIWVCTIAGTPGTWATTISNHMTLRSATATAKYNEITLFTGSTASQTISAPGSPIDSVCWSIINNSSVNVTLGFSANAMYVLGANTSVTTYTVTPGSAYSFVNYNGGNWYMTSTNDLTNGTGVLPTTNGGTGLSTIGTAGQVLTVNSGATGLQYSTPTTTTSVTMGGDVTGNSATSTVAKINGTTLGTLSGATSGQGLVWNGSAWAPSNVSTSVPAVNPQPSQQNMIAWNVDYQIVSGSSLGFGSGANNRIFTSSFIPTTTLNLTTSNKLCIYTGGTSANVNLGIYSGNPTTVGTLLVSTGNFSSGSGSQAVAITGSTTLTAGTTYYLALWLANSSTFCTGYTSNGGDPNAFCTTPITGGLSYRTAYYSSASLSSSLSGLAATAAFQMPWIGIQ